jgi:hypothetical protein
LKQSSKEIESLGLVAQNYKEDGAAELPVPSPTVSRAAQRVGLSIAASLKGNGAYMRDVSMAYAVRVMASRHEGVL